jgi:uncharacterized protein with NAD-binding domain and iron-sulfur cluster
MTEMRNHRRRIAVLGGGVGSMSAVYALMQEPDWTERYEITIYQMGWRLGGKGASGRNADAGQRIEEHGLHIWLGFYENAFRVIRDVYGKLGRPDGAPLREWTDAFKPGNLIVFTEHVGDAWKLWPVAFPTNDELPGEGGTLPEPTSYVHMLIGWMREQIDASDALAQAHAAAPPHAHPAAWILHELEGIGITIAEGAGAALLEAAHLAAARLPERNTAAHHTLLLGMLEHFMHWLRSRIEHVLDTHDELRRLFIIIDIAHAMLRGMLLDGVVTSARWDVINDIDFRAWLLRNGAATASVWSAPIQAIYDLVFAYERGDWRDPNAANLEAGTGCHGVLRMMLTYKGAIYWKMQAGMGDTIFTPFYELMRRHPDNIRFAFFHQVRALDTDGARVNSITLFQQVRLKDGIDAYDPLVDVKGLPCWPSEPRYDQLDPADAHALRKQHINLESFWSPWNTHADERSITLRVDDDYDDVIVGIPPAMLLHLLSDRIKALPRWRDMLAHVQSAQTQSTQLWFHPTLDDLGWTLEPPVLGGFVEPLSTWADMSHLLEREQWTGDAPPQSLAYFTGPMEDAPDIPPATDHEFPDREYQRAVQTAGSWLDQYARTLWPDAVMPDGSLNRALLASAFYRANIDPNERYVLSVVGSSRYRLAADEGGLDNLYLAGDWLRTVINAGCVEAAVSSGLAAGQALAARAEERRRENLDPTLSDATHTPLD